MEHQNTPGPITLDLITFLRALQVWYQTQQCRGGSVPAWHVYTHPIASIASEQKTFSSLRFDHAQGICSFARAPGEIRVAVTVELQGEYLGCVLRHIDGSIVGAAIVRLASNGKALIRIKSKHELVECQIDLHAMQSSLVTVDVLMDFVRDKRNTLFPERSPDFPECFVDLRSPLTLQAYALVRSGVGMVQQPHIVNSALEGVYQVIVQRPRAACLAAANPFQIRIASYLMGDASLTFTFGITKSDPANDAPKVAILKNSDDKAEFVLVACSSEPLATALRKAVIRHLREMSSIVNG